MTGVITSHMLTDVNASQILTAVNESRILTDVNTLQIQTPVYILKIPTAVNTSQIPTAVDTSHILTTVTNTSRPQFMKLSIGQHDGCGVLCQTDKRIYIVNTTSCSQNYFPAINTSVASFTVRIMTDHTQSENHPIVCEWTITKHRNHYIAVTIGQLADTFISNFTLMFSEVGDKGSLLSHAVVDNVKLQHSNFSLLSEKSIRVRLECHEPQSGQLVTLGVDVKEGPYVRVDMLSESVGYVTSTALEESTRCRLGYGGSFSLNIAEDESLLISFFNFSPQFENMNCATYYIMFVDVVKNTKRLECYGMSLRKVRLFRYSLQVFFHTDCSTMQRGFRLMFAILPRHQELRQFQSGLFNCSVPSFHGIRMLFSCNMLTECVGREDEQGCNYNNDVCVKEGARSKCYRLVARAHRRGMTWTDAYERCIQRGQNLVTLAHPEEFRRFRTVMYPLLYLYRVFLGTQITERQQPVSIAALYRNIWQWVDGRMDFSVKLGNPFVDHSCAKFIPGYDNHNMHKVDCHTRIRYPAVVCEFYKPDEEQHNTTKADSGNNAHYVDPNILLWDVKIIQCPKHHVTRDFLSCDTQADCNTQYPVTTCSAGGVTVPMFKCQESRTTVHYTLVCDHMQHCSDNSDEDFCMDPGCSPSSLKCDNGQCAHFCLQCDGKIDCRDGSDELCRLRGPMIIPNVLRNSFPWLLQLDGSGNFRVHQMKASDSCRPTHFLCPRVFCLPVYLRCNAVDDCPGREDEAACDSYECHGFYRCRGSKACLHADHVCDGVPQCPQQDDELLCGLDLTCPVQCRCQGLAFVCGSHFSAISYPALRYLDVSGSNMTLSEIRGNIHLIVLRMSKCLITSLLLNMTFLNLKELDLSWNKLYRFHMPSLYLTENLKVLVLTGNPLVQITNTWSSGIAKITVEHVDLSHTNLKVFRSSALAGSLYIKTLNMSWSKLTFITEDGFHATPRLESLDLRGCHLRNFPSTLLRHHTSLRVVYAENYKLCCEAMLPVNFDLQKCYVPQDLLASCEDLLKSNTYRVFLWTFASLSFVGNMFSVGARCFLQQESGGSFSVFVTNLSMADLFMGVYLAIIGTADIAYRGHYLWRDDVWKNSAPCNIAGFLCLLSCEVSAFIICLITLDRFLVLRFPFSRLHFKRRSALAACAVVWALGIAVAIVPLLPMTSHWEFYSQTGICIPLPFTSDEFFRGYVYSFSVSILLNLVLFLFICVGQVVVFLAVRANSMQSSTNTRARDSTIAQRLITVAVSDFLCWFPIGLLGLLAYTGTPIPGELNVAVATFVLPVNSALNPFLYTFNLLMEKRRKAKLEMLLKRFEQERYLQVEVRKDESRTYPESVDKSAALQQIKIWTTEYLLTSEDLLISSDDFAGSDENIVLEDSS